MLTWIGTLRPGNKTIYAVFCVESERPQIAYFLHPDRVLFKKSVPYKIVCLMSLVLN